MPQMVPGAGLEPASLSAGDFESPASTNFATRAEDVAGVIVAHQKGFAISTCQFKSKSTKKRLRGESSGLSCGSRRAF